MRRIRKMTAKQKKLFLLTSMMSVFVMAATVLFAGGKLSLNPLNVRGATEQVEGSITWDWSGTERTKHANNKYTFLKKTQRGTPIYLYSYGQGNQGTNKIWSSKYNTTYSYGLFVSAEPGSPSLFQFQSITSISIVTASTSDSGATFAIYGGGTDTTPLTSKTILSPGQTLTYTPSSTMTQFSINATNGYWVEIQSITVNYSCSYDGGGSDQGEKTLSSITISGQTTEFSQGAAFSFGGTVTAHYSDSTTSNVTSSATFSGYNMSSVGEQTVVVSYTEGGITKTAQYTINISSSSEPQEVTISGTYNYTSRASIPESPNPTPSWSGKMSIKFNNDNTVEWTNDRSSVFETVVCKVYCDYEAINDGSKISISMTLTSYDFKVNGATDTQAKTWSNGSYDRPMFGGFGVGSTNNTGELDLTRTTLTISVYYYDSKATPTYNYYDTFTFTLAS